MPTIYSLLQMCEYLAADANLYDKDKKTIWSTLRVEYYEPMTSHGSDAPGKMMQIIMKLKRIENGGTLLPADWSRLCRLWTECEGYLVNKALPYIKHIGTLLLSECYSNDIKSDDRMRLSMLIESKGPHELNKLADLLLTLQQNEISIPIEDIVGRCKREAMWWYDFFLKPGGNIEISSFPSTLLQILSRCPCIAEASIATAICEMEEQGKTFSHNSLSSNTCVFCDEHLLTNAVAHLIENALHTKHRDKRKSNDFIPKVYFYILESDKKDYVSLVVKNDGTMPTDIAGNGIRTFNLKLNEFGAKMDGKSSEEPNWSWEAKIELERWVSINEY